MRQEGADIPSVELAGMSTVMEENEAPNPCDVGFLGTLTVVARSGASADLVEQSRGLAGGSHGQNLQREGPRWLCQ